MDAGSGPYRPQALYSGALAREQAGDAAGAAAWRASLCADYPETPWAERLGSACSISRTIRSAASPGSAASVIGRPTTR